MDDNCGFIFCSMNSETAVTFTGGHFNQAVYAVYHGVHAMPRICNSYIIGARAERLKPDTSRTCTHDITILCHRHFLVTTIVTMTSNGPIISLASYGVY